MFDSLAHPISYQNLIDYNAIKLDIKRLDLIHPQISGNKFYKLKYNLQHAKELGLDTIITFGGAFSNHIAATAYAAHYFGFKSIGIIRGEELAHQTLNPTLATACQFGMQLQFINRQEYRNKEQSDFIDKLRRHFPTAYIIPEGGTNALAIQGCKEILTAKDRQNYDVICCAVGTGGTITGLIEASDAHQTILGFSALKGDFLQQQVASLTHKMNWNILEDYCFGGYAKTSIQLLDFIQSFEKTYQIPLEPIYTGKMLFGVFELIEQGHFAANTRILVIHSGGLQGRQNLL
ncbi:MULTISPECIES: 1-aminocyclopropane-1-carboxylate deaminase/D-cysteine desulfhydrase [unclassified Acinetobacter]|uniref:1-aminocyclopropane-1-carboxylate deaminase/D-cysteine desulfhydrase n=1 Tax=unclassified Acinetobacter TaxID=196816 RepID=UPI00190D4D36|nr:MULTISPECIES: pyridoxal-phosphate dependent enzyme [unclassified Acinetobacter]MBK0064485.1 1-aminocyclopropane-1-carboxylate deaminase/D-cysteine desulfhydrase [Acinetobacter sp. S55]MBK0067183.1 1-aminocyclopropane-1-carboxylate deaminase/D-cysteine desulfhydrase [Acinetobacter sp. S54]